MSKTLYTGTITKHFDPNSIKTLRVKHGLSQETFAKALGTHAMTISVWERSKVIPGADMIAKMSQIFRVPESFFFTSTD